MTRQRLSLKMVTVTHGVHEKTMLSAKQYVLENDARDIHT